MTRARSWPARRCAPTRSFPMRRPQSVRSLCRDSFTVAARGATVELPVSVGRVLPEVAGSAATATGVEAEPPGVRRTVEQGTRARLPDEAEDGVTSGNSREADEDEVGFVGILGDSVSSNAGLGKQRARGVVVVPDLDLIAQKGTAGAARRDAEGQL